MKGRHVFLCTLGAVAVVVALSVVRPNAITQLDRRAYDGLLRHAARPPATGRISIVAVDEKSIAEIGQWPWGRDVLARLVERLFDLGAGVIAFDIILSEPDRLEGAQLPTTNRREVASTTTDTSLAAALEDRRVVTGYAFTFDQQAGNAAPCVLHPLQAVQVEAPGRASPARRIFRPKPSGVICSLSVFNRAAGASGFLNVSLDSDGVVRRVPLVMEYRGERLSVARARGCAANPWHTDGDYERHKRSRHTRSRGSDDSTRCARPSAASFCGAGRDNPICWRVGCARSTSSRRLVCRPDRVRWWNGFWDEQSGSDSARHGVPGLELHATVAENLLGSDFIALPAYAGAYDLGTPVAAGLAVAVFTIAGGLLWGGIGTAIGCVLVWGLASWALETRDTFLSPCFRCYPRRCRSQSSQSPQSCTRDGGPRWRSGGGSRRIASSCNR